MLAFSTMIVLIALVTLVRGEELNQIEDGKICSEWQPQTSPEVGIQTSTALCSGELDAEFSTNEHGDIYRFCCPFKPMEEPEVGDPPTQCGQQAVKPKHTRIVGGEDAAPYSWPWLVSLQYRGGHFCGGTLIDEYHVLTAAHCLQDPSEFNANLTVVAGLYYRTKPYPNRIQRKGIARITNHPAYNGETKENDVALMRLASPISITSYVNIACLPGKDPGLEESVMIAGWGTTKFEGSSPDTLQQANIEIMDVCNKAYNNYDDEKQICAGNKQYTKDSCQGDSGGPLVYKVDDKWIVSGVVSYGDECAKINKPGVYARVSYYLPWVRSMIESSSKQKSSMRKKKKSHFF